ncbi:MAG: Spy/CpxP family protein refolding chaperone [Rhodothermales bacterium]|nr:Spy/CpxP family protein refolding chaperone [Rhodothermales bacterium]
MTARLLFVGTALVLLSTVGNASDSVAQHRSTYAGQEHREIKSLSNQDLDDLRAGRGWGLARAAELNGVPGPIHLLEMKEEIDLSEEQVAQIERLYQNMKEQAIPLGLKLIELERELDESFANGTIDEHSLKQLLAEIAGVHKDLRYAHLSAHLKTPDILMPSQIENYNRLRGYSTDDPCANVPAGHDPAMWKKHNNCQ